jgi:predicted metalloprotease with PDZ domain
VVRAWGLVGLALSGCVSAARSDRAQPALPYPWRYEVALEPEGRLAIAADLPEGISGELVIEEASVPFVFRLEIEAGPSWHALERGPDGWHAPACAHGGCRIRYTFALEAAARAIADPKLALATSGAILAPPSTWLVRPSEARPEDEYRFSVTTPEGLGFATGVHRSEDGVAYRAAASMIRRSPYAVFGRFEAISLRVAQGQMDVALVGDEGLKDEAIAWVKSSATAVASYLSRFPVDRVLIVLLPSSERERSPAASTLGNGGASILAVVDPRMAKAGFSKDWEMAHEMVHLAFPNLAREHHWLEEGLATYVEPIARAQAGIISTDQVWDELIEGLPKGQPEPGDLGLDKTPTWGRTYWGGAMFYLLADVRIRRKTDGTRSLRDALVGILEEGGNVSVDWSVEKTLAIGDRATETMVLQDLYRSMAHAAVEVDLEALLQELGVAKVQGRVVYDDHAPLARIRRDITAPRTERR